MFILDSFREADNDELYCHVCDLPFTNTSSKQAHFCGRPHSAEIIKKLFSVLGCTNHVKRGRRGKAVKDPSSTCSLVSRNSSAIGMESGTPLQVDVARENFSVPEPPPVPSLSTKRRYKAAGSAGNASSGPNLKDKSVLQPPLSCHTPADQAVHTELGRLATTVSHCNVPSGGAVELSCLAMGSSNTCTPTDSNSSGTALHLSLMDIVTVTDQLLMEGLAHMDELMAIGKDDHPSQSLAGVSIDKIAPTISCILQ